MVTAWPCVQDKVLIFDSVFIKLVEKLRPLLPSVRHYIVLTDQEHMPAGSGDGWLCYDALMAEAQPLQKWPRLDERSTCGICYTSGGHQLLGPVLVRQQCTRHTAPQLCVVRAATWLSGQVPGELPEACARPSVAGAHQLPTFPGRRGLNM